MLSTTLSSYFFVLRVRSYYRPLLSEVTREDASERIRTPRTSKLGQAIVALNHIVIFSFIASLGVICLRALIDRVWSGTLLVLYNVMSFVAVTANMLLMHVEVHKGGGHWSWANYSFWWLILAGESFIGWFHLEGIPAEGNNQPLQEFVCNRVPT